MRQSTFLLPSLLAVLSAVGLITALLGESWWDSLAWVGLGLPALLGCWALLPLRR